MAINNNIIGEANQPSPHGGEMVRGFKNVFVKPDEQNRACSSYAMARKGAMKWNLFVKPNEQNRACSSYAMARKRRMKSNFSLQTQYKLKAN